MTNTLDSTMHGAEDAAKQISASLVRGKGGLAEECQAWMLFVKPWSYHHEQDFRTVIAV